MADDDPYAKYLKPSGKKAPSAASAPSAPAASPTVATPATDIQPATAPVPDSASAAPNDADPYSKFLPASKPATASGPAPGQPGNQTLPWFSATGDSKINAWLNSATDAISFGADDYLTGKLNSLLGNSEAGKLVSPLSAGMDTDALRQRTAELKGDLGPLGAGSAELAGYALGPGKFEAGARLAERLGGGIVSRMVGSAAENAGASVAGTVGHGDFNVGDNLRAAVIGGTVGGLTGALPGGRGAFAPVEKDTTGIFGSGVGAKTANSPTPGLQADTKAAFDPLTTVKIDPGHLGPDFDAVTASLSSGMKTDMGDALTSAARKISQEMADKFRSGDTITADDVAKFQKNLGRAGNAPGAGPSDSVIAQQYSDALSKAVSAAKPSDWGSVTPGTDLSKAIGDANTVGNQFKTSKDIDGWIQQAKTNPNSVPDTVGEALAKTPQFYQTHPDLSGMLQGVADAKPGFISKITSKAWPVLGEAAIGAAGEYIGGQNPLVGGISGAASGLLTGAASRRFRSNDLVTKLAQARHLNATGQKLPTSAFAPSVPVLGPMSVYGRQAAPGIGASGAFVPQTPS